MKPRLLFIGDAVSATGFARSTHHLLDTVRHSYDVHVLGLNYTGDPHPYPYPIYPCWPGGDGHGIRRVPELLKTLTPDLIVIQQDPWNFAPYLKRIVDIPVVGIVAVDGKNCRGAALNGLSHCVFWTEFAQAEAVKGGYTGPSTVIPLGVDLDIYHPQDRETVREGMHLGFASHAFVVGVVGRNQQRKRLDLTIKYFAEWIESRHVEDAVLWLHVAPTADQAYDLDQLVTYYGIGNRVVIPELDPVSGLSEALLAQCYNVFDVGLTTTQGEGFGLPCLEMMACGIPQIVPNWSALGEWTRHVAIQVPCPSTAATPNCINVIGGVPDEEATIQALDDLYRRATLRLACHDRGLELANDPRFRWGTIGQAVTEVLDGVLQGVAV